MAQDNITNLYNALKDSYELGSEDDFRTSLKDANNRKNLYSAISNDFELGSEDDFNTSLGYGANNQAQNVAQTEQPEATISNTDMNSVVEQFNKEQKDRVAAYNAGMTQQEYSSQKSAEQKQLEEMRSNLPSNLLPVEEKSEDEIKLEMAKQRASDEFDIERFNKAQGERAKLSVSPEMQSADEYQLYTMQAKANGDTPLSLEDFEKKKAEETDAEKKSFVDKRAKEIVFEDNIKEKSVELANNIELDKRFDELLESNAQAALNFRQKNMMTANPYNYNLNYDPRMYAMDQHPEKVIPQLVGESMPQVEDMVLKSVFGDNYADGSATIDINNPETLEKINRGVDVAVGQLQGMMQDMFVKKNSPSNFVEYIANDVFYDNTTSQLLEGLMTRIASLAVGEEKTSERLLANNLFKQGIAEYGENASAVTQGVSAALKMTADLPYFAVGGIGSRAVGTFTKRFVADFLGQNVLGRRAVASSLSTALSKEAMSVAERAAYATPLTDMISNYAQRMVMGGMGFGGYEGVVGGVDVIGDIETYQNNWDGLLNGLLHVGKSYAGGFETGAELALVNGLITGRFPGNTKWGKIKAESAGIAGEIGFFTAKEAYEYAKAHDMEMSDVPIWQIVGKNTVMIGGMKLQHIGEMKERFNRIDDKDAFNIRFNKDNLEELKSAGYANSGIVSFMQDLMGSKGKKQVADGEYLTNDMLDKILADPCVSLDTKRKLQYIFDGKIYTFGKNVGVGNRIDGKEAVERYITDPNEAITDVVQTELPDGRVMVTSANQLGQVVRRRHFKSSSDAEEYLNQQKAAAEFNVLKWAEYCNAAVNPEIWGEVYEQFKDVQKIIEKPYELRSKEEEALVKSYLDFMYRKVREKTVDPRVIAVEDRSDENGEVVSVTTKEGKEGTAKGIDSEGESVVFTDSEGSSEMLPKSDVTETGRVPVEDAVKEAVEEYDFDKGVQNGNIIRLKDEQTGEWKEYRVQGVDDEYAYLKGNETPVKKSDVDAAQAEYNKERIEAEEAEALRQAQGEAELTEQNAPYWVKVGDAVVPAEGEFINGKFVGADLNGNPLEGVDARDVMTGKEYREISAAADEAAATEKPVTEAPVVDTTTEGNNPTENIPESGNNVTENIPEDGMVRNSEGKVDWLQSPSDKAAAHLMTKKVDHESFADKQMRAIDDNIKALEKEYKKKLDKTLDIDEEESLNTELENKRAELEAQKKHWQEIKDNVVAEKKRAADEKQAEAEAEEIRKEEEAAAEHQARVSEINAKVSRGEDVSAEELDVIYGDILPRNEGESAEGYQTRLEQKAEDDAAAINAGQRDKVFGSLAKRAERAIAEIHEGAVDEISSADMAAAHAVATGAYKFTRESLARGLGSHMLSGKQRSSYLSMMDNKNGVSIEKAAEMIAEANGIKDQEKEIRDALIDFIKNGRRAATEWLEERAPLHQVKPEDMETYWTPRRIKEQLEYERKQKELSGNEPISDGISVEEGMPWDNEPVEEAFSKKKKNKSKNHKYSGAKPKETAEGSAATQVNETPEKKSAYEKSDEEVKAGKKSGIYDNGKREQAEEVFGKHAVRQLERLSERLGVTVVFEDNVGDIGEDGYGVGEASMTKNGVMRVAITSKDGVFKALEKLQGHELLHHTKNHLGEDGINKLYRLMRDTLGESEISRRLEEVKERYGENATEDELFEEVLADFLGEIMDDTTTAVDFLFESDHGVLGAMANAIDEIKTILTGSHYDRVSQEYLNALREVKKVINKAGREPQEMEPEKFSLKPGYDFAFSKSEDEFVKNWELAKNNRGVVREDADKVKFPIVSIPKHDFTGTGKEAIAKARLWAQENLAGTHIAHEGKEDEFKYTISSDVKDGPIGKFLSASATKGSSNLGVHLAALKKLPEIIDNSIEVEYHADYPKVEGERSGESDPNNENVLIHRLYSAVDIDGKLYRAKTTIKEFKGRGNEPYTYKITDLELLNGGSTTSDAPNNKTSVIGSDLLRGVEKSKDPGLLLLGGKVSKNVSDDQTSDVKNDENGKKFSLKKTREEKGELVALHNLSADKLEKALALGGMPMPSIAITKAEVGHEDFGDISLVFDKQTINPSDRRNTVWDRDAWTPTRPQIEKKLSESVVDNISKTIRGLVKEGDRVGRISLDEVNIEDRLKKRNWDAVEAYADEPVMKQAYLAQQGKNAKMPKVEKTYGSHDVETLKKILDLFEKAGIDLDKVDTSSFYWKYEEGSEEGNIVKDIAKILLEEDLAKFSSVYDKHPKAREHKKEYYDNLGFSDYDNVIRHLYEIKRDLANNNGKIPMAVDKRAAREELDKKVPTSNKKYREWIAGLFEGVVEKEGIYNGKDLYTPSGSRRSFEALHDNVTLGNILKAMLREPEKAASVFASPIGAAAKKLNSIDEIRKEGHERINPMDEKELDEWKEGVLSRVFDICFAIKNSEYDFSTRDDVAEMIAKHGENAKAMYNELHKWRPKFTMQMAEDLVDIVKEIRKAPVNFFEAKPRRAVGFNEVKVAVVPKGTKKSLVDALKNAGTKVVSYDPNVEGNRAEVLNNAVEKNDMKFSLKSDKKFVENAKKVGLTDKQIEDMEKYSIKVWHGSGADFDEFDSKHMGEGEGAQAHGWGHYVAVSRETGKRYANLNYRKTDIAFYDGQLLSDDLPIVKAAKQMYPRIDTQRLIRFLSYGFNGYTVGKLRNEARAELRNNNYKQHDEILDLANALSLFDPKLITHNRNLYEVEIPDGEYLEEAKPVDEETIGRITDGFKNLDGFAVREVHGEVVVKNGNENVETQLSERRNGNYSGYDLYQRIGDVIGEYGKDNYKAASEFLASLGYKGIHYDGRSDGECYVVFNDNDLKITNHEKFSLKREKLPAVNEEYNKKLGEYKDEDADKMVFHLGEPSEILVSAGVQDKPIKLYGSKIRKKLKDHPTLKIEELRDLPNALFDPIAVFDNHQSDENRSVLTELTTSDGNILVAIDFGKGGDVDFNLVSTMFGKNNNNIIDWINKPNYLKYVNKEKAQKYLHLVAPIATASDSPELAAAKIVKDFENPPLPESENESGGANTTDSATPEVTKYSLKRGKDESYADYAKRVVDDADYQKEGEDWKKIKKGESYADYAARIIRHDQNDKERMAANAPATERDEVRYSLKSNREAQQKLDDMKTAIADMMARQQGLKNDPKALKTLVADLTRYVRDNIDAPLAKQLGSAQIKQILSDINAATSKQDLEQPIRDINVMLNNVETGLLANMKGKLLNYPMQGKNQRGVQVAKGVDEDTRVALKNLGDHLKEETADYLNDYSVDEQEYNDMLANGQQVPVELENRMNISYPLRKINAEANGMWRELQQAKQDWQDAVSEIYKIKRAPGYMAQRAAARQRAQAFQDIYIQKQHEYNSLLRDFDENIGAVMGFGSKKLQAAKKAENARRQNLIHNAMGDVKFKHVPLEGEKGAVDERGRFAKGVDKAVEAMLSTRDSFGFLCQTVDENHPNKMGFLYQYFYLDPETSIVAANNQLADGRYDFGKNASEAAERFFGDEIKLNWLNKRTDKNAYAKLTEMSRDEVEETITRRMTEGEAASYNKAAVGGRTDWHAGEDYVVNGKNPKGEHNTMTKGHALYLWLTWRQPDGRIKMMNAGYDQSAITQIEKALGGADSPWIKYGEWVTEEFLPKLREKYNQRHIEMYGTSMAKNPHYFPIKIDRNSIMANGELGKPQEQFMPSTIAPNLIHRSNNQLPVDWEANAFDILRQYGETMEHWYAMSPIIRDINTLHQSRAFRKALEANKRGLSKRFFDAAQVATGSLYESEEDAAAKLLNKAVSMGARAAIGFKGWTALKQIASYPAFATHSASPKFQAELIKNVFTPVSNYNWALENLPSFRQRVRDNDMGLEGVNDEGFFGEYDRLIAKWGMKANKAIDQVTVANGARAVYNEAYRKNKKQGMTNEEAHRRAVLAAEICYNESQQSSRNEFSAKVQKNNNSVMRSLILFQNANISYRRKIDLAVWDVYKAIRNNKNYNNMGKNVFGSATADIINYGVVLPVLWGLMSRPQFILGNMSEDEKNAIYKDALLGLAVNGYLTGSPLNSALNGYKVQQNPGIDFINEIVQKVINRDLDEKASWYLADKLSSVAVGVSVNTWRNIIGGVVGLCSDGWNVDTAVDMMMLLNLPKSAQIELYPKIYAKYGPNGMANAFEKAYLWERTDNKFRDRARDYIKGIDAEFMEDMEKYTKLYDELHKEETTDERVEEIINKNPDFVDILQNTNFVETYQSALDIIRDKIKAKDSTQDEKIGEALRELIKEYNDWKEKHN